MIAQWPQLINSCVFIKNKTVFAHQRDNQTQPTPSMQQTSKHIATQHISKREHERATDAQITWTHEQKHYNPPTTDSVTADGRNTLSGHTCNAQRNMGRQRSKAKTLCGHIARQPQKPTVSLCGDMTWQYNAQKPNTMWVHSKTASKTKTMWGHSKTALKNSLCGDMARQLKNPHYVGTWQDSARNTHYVGTWQDSAHNSHSDHSGLGGKLTPEICSKTWFNSSRVHY